jgi:hypothetical protein
MNCNCKMRIILSALLTAIFALPTVYADAQNVKDIAGTYMAVSSPPFGPNPRGQMILGNDGRYSLFLARAMLPKFEAGARSKGTAEENQAIIGGSIAHYGKYTVDDKEKVIIFNIEASTYPNWDGMTFKRPLKMSGDQLTYTNNSPSDGGSANDVVWKRIK